MLLKIRVTGQRGHINLKKEPWCWKSRLADGTIFCPRHKADWRPALTNPASLSHHCWERNPLSSVDFYVFLWLSSSCLLVNLSLSKLTISPSYVHQQHRLTLSLACHRMTISLTITLKKLELTILALLHLFFQPKPQLVFPFLPIHFTPYMPFPHSVSSARWQSPSLRHVSRRLKVIRRGGKHFCTTAKQHGTSMDPGRLCFSKAVPFFFALICNFKTISASVCGGQEIKERAGRW